MMRETALPDGARSGSPIRVFVASAVLLFAELLIVRWTGAELWSLAFFKNLVLIAAFLGSGLGMAIGARRPRLVWMAPALVLVFAVAVPWASRSGALEKLHFGGEGDFFWQLATASSLIQSVTFFLFFVLLFVLSFLLFVAFGVLVGRELVGLPPLTGYAWNLGGSLLGVLAFAAVSLAELSPGIWILILALPLGFTVARGRWAVLATAVTAVASLLAAVLSETATWSPYSRITVNEWVEQGETEMKGYELSVNRAYHMTIVDLRNPPTTDGWYQRAALHYDLPYRFTRPQRVLVLGSGGGNDVAAALRAGAQQVDAVEIDPVIVRAGRNLHPERPYHSPRVGIHVDDARSFLERSDQYYDLIALGLLDSHTLLAGLPGVRLDNYVYTVEAMRAARRRLSPSGMLSLSFAALGDRPWLAEKLYRMIELAFEEPPLVFPVGYDFSITFLAGPGLATPRARAAVEAMEGLRLQLPGVKSAPSIAASTAIPTDDWPQLYLQSRTIPAPQLLLVGLLVVVSLGATRTLAPFAGRPNAHFALLGAGFLLVETKGIADLGLLFGGTWWTVTVVIAAVLAMALLSVLFVSKVNPLSVTPYYAGLVVALLTTFAVRPGVLLSLPLPIAQTAAAFLVAVPVFFSGVIFSISLARTSDTARALGSNLLGAVLGGFLEYASLAWGVRSLSLVAIGLYLLSALALANRKES